MADKASWNFAEGDEIVPGQRAMRSLGGGNTFEVYLARDEKRLALVACKLVRPDQVAEARALRMLRRESRMLARLSHPAIIRVLETTLEGPRPHLLMEYAERGTLRARLRRRGPLPLERLLPLALQLGAALHYLAREGVVHLDVKPGNIALDSSPRLIDLSVARSLERAERIRRPVGTAAYMAPEQCAPGQRGTIGSPADVWGMGMSLYEAVSGALPFPRSAARDAAGAPRYPQLTDTPATLAGAVPAALAVVIMQCLAPDSTARPTAAQVVRSLEALQASEARTAAAVTASRNSSRPS